MSYSRADRDEPDRREYTYEQQTLVEYVTDPEDREVIVDTLTSQVWQLSTRTNSFMFTRMFGRMDEEERGPEAHLSVPFHQWAGLESRLKLGALHRNKDRDARWRRFYFGAPSSFAGASRDSILALGPEELMTDERIGGTNRDFRLGELTRDRDCYRAHSTLTAGYLMVDLPVRRDLRTVFGARVETSRMEVESYDPFGATADTLPRSTLDDTDLLPSINVTWNPREQMNVRAAYSATVSRPDFRELSAFAISDFVSGYERVGNPDLKRARIHNLDLRVESYPTGKELLAASLFYKKLIGSTRSSRASRWATTPSTSRSTGGGDTSSEARSRRASGSGGCPRPWNRSRPRPT
jgi:outer membrane receptor protein involved in Fe transport